MTFHLEVVWSVFVFFLKDYRILHFRVKSGLGINRGKLFNVLVIQKKYQHEKFSSSERILSQKKTKRIKTQMKIFKTVHF